MAEVPWYPGRTEPLPAALFWLDDDPIGHLHFLGPQGDYATIPVRRSKDVTLGKLPIWDIVENGDDVTITPSIWFKGHWHSPFTTRWRIVLRDNTVGIPDTIEILANATVS